MDPLHLKTMDIKTEDAVDIDAVDVIKSEETEEMYSVGVIKWEETLDIDATDVIKSENLSDEGKIPNEPNIDIKNELGNYVKQEPECEDLKIEPYFILELENQEKIVTKTDLIDVLKSEDGEILNEVEIKEENEVSKSSVEEQADWKGLKIESDEVIFCADVISTCPCSKRTDPSERSVRDVELEPTPSKRMKVAKEGCICYLLKSETRPKFGEVSNDSEIKVEDGVEDGNSNVQQAEFEEVKTEPACSDPAQNVEVKSEGGQIQNEFRVENDVGGEEPSLKEHVGRNIDPTTTFSEHSYSRNFREPKLKITPINTKFTPEKPNQSQVDPLHRYGFDRLRDQLISFRPMSEIGARILCRKFLCEIMDFIFAEAQRVTLHAFQLRLIFATVARIMDFDGFTPDDEWFINLKNQLPQDFFVGQRRLHYVETRIRLGDDAVAIHSRKTELFAKLAVWYHKASTALVEPGQLERAANGIAEVIGLENFFLSKNDMLLFVLQQGLYRNINGKVSLIMKVKDGLLGLLFDAMFEIWYYEWPKSTDDLLQEIRHRCDERNWSMFKGYVAILLDYLVEGAYLDFAAVARPLPSCSLTVVCGEKEIAAAVFGRKLATYRAVNSVFYKKLQAEICKIQYFNSAFGRKYCYRSYTFCSDHLKKNAEELALNMGMGLCDVVISKNWLRRFAELTVACSLTPDESHSHPKDLDNYFPLNREDFDHAFEHWYNNGCPKDVPPYSCIAAGSIEPYDPSSKAAADGNLIEEVDNWYIEHNRKGFVKFHELKEKAEEIAYFMGLCSFKADPQWMKKCLIRNGLRYYNQRDGLITFSKPELTKGPEFSKLFDAWFREGFCKKCSKRVGYQISSDTGKTVLMKSSLMDSTVRDWYVGLHYSIAPGLLEKKAAEVAKTLQEKHDKNFTQSRSWVEDFIEQNGLYTEDGQLFFKSSFEFLRSTFLCEFEIWYHQWPLTLEKSLQTGSVTKANFEMYKQSLLEWYLKVSQLGKIPCEDIETKSMSIIKKKMTGITPEDVKVWTKCWCRQCNHVIRRIRGFDYAMRIWYFENKKARFITAQELKTEAEQCAAKRVGFPNFVATHVWLKRFVERYGVYSVSAGDPKCLTIPQTLPVDVLQNDFDALFTAWYVYNPTDEPKESPVVESEFDSGPSSGEPNSGSVEGIKMLSDDDDQEPQSSAFEAEVALWYWKLSSKFEVPPDCYLKKVLGIPLDLGLYKGLVFGAGQRKNCIKKLFVIHGLEVSSPWFSENIRLVPAHCSILKWRFELAFEIWYYAYPLRVEDVKPEDCPLTGADLNLVELYLSALHVWYVNLGQTGGQKAVSPEEIRVKEAEIASKLAPSVEKRALIARWCRGWCSESVAWIGKIVRLDSDLGSWYNSKKYLVTPNDLRLKAEKIANTLGIKEFCVSQKWMRRFLQLHGLHFMRKGVAREFSGLADGLVNPNWSEFRTYYNEWLDTSAK